MRPELNCEDDSTLSFPQTIHMIYVTLTISTLNSVFFATLPLPVCPLQRLQQHIHSAPWCVRHTCVDRWHAQYNSRRRTSLNEEHSLISWSTEKEKIVLEEKNSTIHKIKINERKKKEKERWNPSSWRQTYRLQSWFNFIVIFGFLDNLVHVLDEYIL